MLEDERRAVAERVADLAARTPGRSGNLSVRRGERMAITPSGVPYPDVEPETVAVVSRDGARLAGEATPSSETPLHLAVYDALPDHRAVVHAHAPWSTTLASLRRPLPPVHYALARAGGRVPVADYATYGTEALAAGVAETLSRAGTSACLLANHGVLAAGPDLDAAFETLDAVEFTARLYCQAAAVGDPVALDDDELERVAERFASYGPG